MNLWLVLYITGQIAVTWGPFPQSVTFPQCQRVALDQKEAAVANKTVAGVDANDMEFRCLWRDEQPPVGEAIRRPYEPR